MGSNTAWPSGCHVARAAETNGLGGLFIMALTVGRELKGIFIMALAVNRELKLRFIMALAVN